MEQWHETSRINDPGVRYVKAHIVVTSGGYAPSLVFDDITDYNSIFRYV